MARFDLGQRVTVLTAYPTGPGTIHDVFSGPDDVGYRVLMDQRNEHGRRIMAMAYASDLVAADPIEPYQLNQRVTYLGRAGTITDMVPSADEEDPRYSLLEIACDDDPPEEFSGVQHHYTFVLPAWKLFAYAR